MLRPRSKVQEEKNLRKVAELIVQKAKNTARYDQGTLFKSISYTFTKGVLIFRQIFYGQYHQNSQLEKIAAKYVPKGVQYRIVLTDFRRRVKSQSRLKTGTKEDRGLLSGVATSLSIRSLIAKNKARVKKENEE